MDLNSLRDLLNNSKGGRELLDMRLDSKRAGDLLEFVKAADNLESMTCPVCGTKLFLYSGATESVRTTVHSGHLFETPDCDQDQCNYECDCSECEHATNKLAIEHKDDRIFCMNGHVLDHYSEFNGWYEQIMFEAKLLDDVIIPTEWFDQAREVEKDWLAQIEYLEYVIKEVM